jgi:hypothetical protein
MLIARNAASLILLVPQGAVISLSIPAISYSDKESLKTGIRRDAINTLRMNILLNTYCLVFVLPSSGGRNKQTTRVGIPSWQDRESFFERGHVIDGAHSFLVLRDQCHVAVVKSRCDHTLSDCMM